MAKKIQFWMTDDEFTSMDEFLARHCNDNKCSKNDAYKSAILEYFRSKPEKKKEIII